jgi:hypothetical protein
MYGKTACRFVIRADNKRSAGIHVVSTGSEATLWQRLHMHKRYDHQREAHWLEAGCLLLRAHAATGGQFFSVAVNKHGLKDRPPNIGGSPRTACAHDWMTPTAASDPK